MALLVGGALVGGMWALHERAWPQVWAVALQWWWLPVGVLGWGIVAALGSSAARAGVSVTLAVVLSAQLLTGLALDQMMGHLEVGVRHTIGVVLLAASLLLVTARP